jgi:hypothetical protein
VSRANGGMGRPGNPDGNGWMPLEVTAQLPGRMEADTTFTSAAELAATLRRAAARMAGMRNQRESIKIPFRKPWQ